MLFDFIKPDLRLAFIFAVMYPCLPFISCLTITSNSGAFLVFEEGAHFDQFCMEQGNRHKESDTFNQELAFEFQ